MSDQSNDLSPALGGPDAPRPELYPGFTPPESDDPRWAAGPWTRFMDMHSGGGCKLGADKIYIQAESEVAERVFQAKFDRNPHRVTCTCCGPDFSVGSTEPDLYEATGYDRNCKLDTKSSMNWRTGVRTENPNAPDRYVEEPDPERSYGRYIPLAEYINEGIKAASLDEAEYNRRRRTERMPQTVKVVYADEITPEERAEALRPSGFMWMGD